MEIAPIPEDEKLRLDALYRYEILDTEAEELFDDLVQLASSICETPIALVSLIDSDRQWFKAKCGLEASETSRDIAFCSHAILERDVLNVADALEDNRFADNPLVTGDPKIRFYAGAPLVTKDNYSLGTLCVIDREPRMLRPDQIEALQLLSKQAINSLDTRIRLRKSRELNENNNRMLSIISHDIRSPLCTMISIHEMLSDTTALSDERREQLIDLLSQTAESALKTAEELLTLAQSERGFERLELVNVRLDETVLDLQSLTAGSAASKNLDMSYPEESGIEVLADRTLLHSILQNLLSNAVKFTEPGGTIELDVRAEGDDCVICVQDDGRGIRPDVVEQLFSEESSYSTTGSAGERGSGMGLALCKRSARRLGGDLWIESQLDEGTKAYLRIPLAS